MGDVAQIALASQSKEQVVFPVVRGNAASQSSERVCRCEEVDVDKVAFPVLVQPNLAVILFARNDQDRIFVVPLCDGVD